MPCKPLTPEKRMERFIQQTAKTPDGCWIWQRALQTKGYARVKIERRYVYVHVWIYEQMVGPVPEGMELHHRCQHRDCVNPYHVSPVTRKQHVHAGDSPPGRNSRKKSCPKGHPYDRITTYGYRRCSICYNEWFRNRRKEATL